jgi:hypothetical protein
MCGSSKQTTKSSQETRALQPYGTTYDNILNKANTASNAAYDPATEARVAGFSAPQTQAFGQVQNNLGSYQPYMDQAGQNIDYSAAPVTGSDINNYMDPYLQNVVDMTQNTFDTQNARAAQQLKGEMARRSPVMGSGRDVAAALQSEANQNAQNPIIAQLYSQGFGQAQQAAQADKNRALSAGQAQGNLGGLAQSYGYNDVNALLGVGGMQQDLSQAEYDASSANAMARASYPMDMINWQSQIATGLGGAAGSTSSGTGTTTQKSNPLQQIVGGAIGGLGILSKMKTGGFALGGGVTGHSYVPKAGEMTGIAPGGQAPSIASQTAPTTDGGFPGMLENYKQGRELMDSLNGLGKSPAEANGWTTTATREGYATKGGVWPSEQDDGGLGDVFSKLGAMPLVSPNATGGMDAGPPRVEQAAPPPPAPPPTGLFGMSDAASDGFISAGFGMMGANGPNWFGQGAQQGFKSYQGSKESQAEAAVRKLQQDRLTAQARIQQDEADRATAISPYQLRMAQAQAERAERELAAPQGEIKEVDKRLIRVNPDGSTTQLYGPDPNAVGAGFESPKQLADVEEGMRKEVAAGTKEWSITRDAHSKIRAIASQPPSPAGDMGLVFGIMKMYDPNSVVRETEYATAQNAAGVPERIRNMWAKVKEGEFLTPEQRADFVKQSDLLAQSMAQRTAKYLTDYQGVAKRKNVDPANVILDNPDDVRKVGDNSQALKDAKEAIAKGVPKEKVIQRLREQGILSVEGI